MPPALLAAVLAYALSVAVGALLMPERVPLHFGAAGQADRFGSRGEALQLLAGLGVVLVAVAAGSLRLVRSGSLSLINVPHPEHWKTAEHEPELRRRLHQDVSRLLTATLLLCCTIPLATASAARGDDDLPVWFFLALAGYLVWVVGWTAHLVLRRYRP